MVGETRAEIIPRLRLRAHQCGIAGVQAQQLQERLQANVIRMERRALKGGSQVIAVVSKAKPAFAGVDPYIYYIDRNADDNLVAVD